MKDLNSWIRKRERRSHRIDDWDWWRLERRTHFRLPRTKRLLWPLSERTDANTPLTLYAKPDWKSWVAWKKYYGNYFSFYVFKGTVSVKDCGLSLIRFQLQLESFNIQGLGKNIREGKNLGNFMVARSQKCIFRFVKISRDPKYFLFLNHKNLRCF